MGVTSENVIVGIGDFKIDSVSMGSTAGGINITKETEVLEKMVDQQLDPVGIAKVREVYRVSTQFAETDLARLKIFWDVPNAVEEVSPNRTLSLGTSSSITYKTLTFYGKSPEGYDREFHAYKVFISEVGDTMLSKGDLSVVPVTFTMYADTTKPSGKQLGYINDTMTA